jgi:hypothetical protein
VLGNMPGGDCEADGTGDNIYGLFDDCDFTYNECSRYNNGVDQR